MALAAAVIAVSTRLVMDPVWGAKLPYITSYPAVMMTAWFAGFGPALLTTLLCAAGAAYFWLPPVGFGVSDPKDFFGLLIFVGISGVVGGLSESRHRTKSRRHAPSLTPPARVS